MASQLQSTDSTRTHWGFGGHVEQRIGTQAVRNWVWGQLSRRVVTKFQRRGLCAGCNGRDSQFVPDGDRGRFRFNAEQAPIHEPPLDLPKLTPTSAGFFRTFLNV